MTATPLYSEHWYRVQNLRPRLASDVEVRRHLYRGQVWYVLHRRSSHSYQRLPSRVYRLVEKLDGNTSVDELWDRTVRSGGADAPSQQELIDLLRQLHEAELLVIDRKLNAERLFARGSDNQRQDLRARYLNPLYLRFALFDPDALLNRLAPLARALFSRAGGVGWLLLMFVALLQLLPRLDQLRFEIGTFDIFSPTYSALFLLLYPLLKALHELAHGLAVKRHGGEVHEMGVALMVLLPIPYMDASASGLFAEKRQRITVGAAGILTELAIAAVATLVWVASAEGLVHQAALMLMLVGGLSTVLFNGNPLLKFDGYYVLADSIEIPNLAERSKRYVLERVQCWLFGAPPAADSIVADAAERNWLSGYAVLATSYRIALLLTIALLLSQQYFFFGVALALWVLVTLFGLPAWRFARFLYGQQQRLRGVWVTALIAGVTIGFVGFLPLPRATVTDGVVWLPDSAIIRAPFACEVTLLEVPPTTTVAVAQPLLECHNPQLTARKEQLLGQSDELRARRLGLPGRERVRRALLDEELRSVEHKLASATQRLARASVQAAIAGTLVVPDTRALTGQHYRQGEIIAYVVPPLARQVRVALSQTEIGPLRSAPNRIELKFLEQPGPRPLHTTTIVQQTPGAQHEVPAAALTTVGGGSLAADPASDGLSVLDPVFLLQLAWPDSAPPLGVGGRVRVKFVHNAAPLAERLYAAVQRVFLGRLST